LSTTVTDFYWTPDPEVHARAFDRVALALANQTRPLVAAGEVTRADIQERFETETAPDGSAWQDWSESYKPIAEEFPNVGILHQTGDLMEAATSTESVMVRGDTVFYRTPFLPHFGLAHDAGLPDRKNPLPQREFLGMSEEAAVLIYANFIDWFEGAISWYPTASGKIGRRHSFRDPETHMFASRESMDIE
jgi:hypothetical protein